MNIYLHNGPKIVIYLCPFVPRLKQKNLELPWGLWDGLQKKSLWGLTFYPTIVGKKFLDESAILVVLYYTIRGQLDGRIKELKP